MQFAQFSRKLFNRQKMPKFGHRHEIFVHVFLVRFSIFYIKKQRARADARALFSLHNHLYYAKLPFAVREVAHGEVYLG